MTDALRECADGVIETAANNLIDAWDSGAGATGGDLIKNKLEQAAAAKAAQIASAIEEAARNAGSVLAKAAMALELENGPERDELLDVLKNMPRFDLGNLEIEVGPSAVAALLGRRWATARVERRIGSQAGDQIADAVGIYARVLQSWVRKTFTELQEQFDSYADAYRAHLDRMAANKTGVEDEQALPRRSRGSRRHRSERRGAGECAGHCRVSWHGVMGDRPAMDSRHYIVAFELRSTDDCPPDFELPSTLAGFDAGLFLPRDDPDWFGRSFYPPRILLLKDSALYIVSHPSTGEPPRQFAMEQIASVESGHMLLKGWLRFTGSGFDCTVPYNTRGFPAVFRFMRRFRDKLLRGAQPPATAEADPGAGLDIKFGNALARELDSGEAVLMQAFQPPTEAGSRSLVASTPALDRRRFAGADRQAAAVDYGPGAGILFAIREHRVVCSIRRRAKHRPGIGPARTHSPSGFERRFRLADSDRARKSLGLPTSRGRFRRVAGDSKEAQ